MGDFGKGLKSFKKGMKDDDEEEIASEEEPKVLKSESVAAPAPEKDRAAEG